MIGTPFLLEFDEPTHSYKLDGRPVPGVTSVLDPLQKLDDIPPDVLAAAAEFGQHVHQACHLHNLDDLDWQSLDPRLALYVEGYRNFLADTGFQVIHSEKRVASKRCQYAGTLDLFGLLQRRPSMIDIKSTAALPRIVGPQTAAYSEALTETTGEKAARRYCLHLGPHLGARAYKLVEQKNPQDFTVFVSALNIYRWRAVA
jgi:hypothetical protein